MKILVHSQHFFVRKLSALAEFLRTKSKDIQPIISSRKNCLPLPHHILPEPKGQDLDFINVAHSHLIHTDWPKLAIISSGLDPFRTKHILLKIQQDPLLSLEFYDWVELQKPSSHSIESHAIIIHILTKAKRFKVAQSLLTNSLIPKTRDLSSDFFDAILCSYRMCDSSPRVFDSLFKTYAHMKKFHNCTVTFCRMRDYGFRPTIESCNAYISSLLGLGRTDIILAFYKEIVRCRISPNIYTLNMVISAYCKLGQLEKALLLFKDMKNMSCEPTLVSYNTLIAGYCKMENTSMAINLKTLMSKHGLVPNVTTFNTLIHGFSKVGKMHEASKLFGEMKMMDLKPNNITYNTLINGYSNQKNSEMGINLYEDMLRNGLEADILTLNALILGLCKEGKTKKASFLVKEMVKGDLVPNASTYSALICGECFRNNAERAFLILKKMIRSGFHPNADTLNIMIATFCRNKDYEGALYILVQMVDLGMTPDQALLLEVVEGLGNHNAKAETVQKLCVKLDMMHLPPKCLDRAKLFFAKKAVVG